MTNIKEQNVQVKISSDGCKATISLKQDPSHPNLSIDELTEILKDHGVVYGIQKEVMMIIVGKYRQGSEINSILVAEGVAPFEGVQPAVNYKFELSSKPKETEESLIDEALKRAEGNQTIAADLLGISRRALNNRLKRANENNNR